MNAEGLVMEERVLTETLRTIVLQHGIERVEQELLKIRNSSDSREHRIDHSVAHSKSRRKLDTNQRRKVKITASAFVSKLEVSTEARSLLEELATRYENKEFLPTVGEIRNFCTIHGIDVSTSISRVAAVPRIFKYLSRLDSQEIQSMLRTNSYSGPTQLGPIAEAIRRTSKQRAKDVPSFDSTEKSASEKREMKADKFSKPPIPSNI